ncbi:MAG: hypothetical protein A2445_04730 [Candidatus Jacksonbacteria bacterium RIFOXYC2_FULL_44_29]|nr:MAG: hypothetical protein UW45_C0041G0008 [Parcubacteria group bacterium GW2011_GWC2_44_22]OGY74457.1 MAG: hypothetical protein A2240_02590 [Candidatus Jacksonbacteria bacterium RIFOXYA2_FULL_43_12]OGY77027.1 MAG: hypothetical protein A2295_00565 [Candidatus Jacksonbacteria bacterium RIFOXYB2_FULL_44_15]OGY78056.1 MAG: hypothetical protein A2550_03445 [Candidatus Jacksonbacteria bacterium RIFOXYD2_FULL_43_21]OGY79730.1 MAG: hypothetical protein A2445_04730 [Candidatus Jacksonbacteria bacteri
MENEQKMNQKFIPVTIDKSHLVTIGEKLYTEKMSFLRELVNNAYDADATEVRINVAPETITIADNGSGMDENGLVQYFNIGSSFKKGHDQSSVFGRQRIGEFGIGKFAVLSSCKVFIVETQQAEFRAQLVFDKETWSRHHDWHVNIDIFPKDTNRGNGTTIILRNIDGQFQLPKIRRYLTERTPINAPNFCIFLNGEKVTADITVGRQLPFHHLIQYGIIIGQIVITPANYRSEKMGIAVLVKGVLIRYETFGLETSRKWGVARITGKVSADFLPITSNRDDFLRDSPEFIAFTELMKKEIVKALHLVRQEGDAKANAQAAKVLKEALLKIGKAMKNFKHAFPPAQVPMGEAAPPGLSKTGPGYEISKAEFVDFQTNLDPEIQKRLQENKKKKKSRGRPSAILGNKSIVRTLKVANLDIAVRLEHLGGDDESMIAGGVIYINLDHPLYRTYQKNDDQLTQHIARILTKELTLQTGIKDAEQAFALQAGLLADALKDKGA